MKVINSIAEGIHSVIITLKKICLFINETVDHLREKNNNLWGGLLNEILK